MSGVDDEARLSLIRLAELEIDRRFVAREAGDEPMPERDRAEHERKREQRGRELYVDLLFVLTHMTYEPARARELWEAVMSHKRALSDTLGRNVGVAVAAVDYLSNVLDELHNPVVLHEEKIDSAAELATRDVMTGLYDHSTFQLVLRTELERAKRYPKDISVIMLDVDHFKAFNDRYGHPAGDRVLKRIARILQAEVRQVDSVCRYGGEEFAVVAPRTGRDEAYVLAERVRERVERDLAGYGVTVSLGVATFPADATTASECVRAADQALYASKQAGRNRTTGHS